MPMLLDQAGFRKRGCCHIRSDHEGCCSLSTVLLVEDDVDDVVLIGLAFRRGEMPCQLQTVPTIAQARDYLCGRGIYGDRKEFPLPSIIITDLRFASPGESGLQFLQWLHGSPFQTIPIACITDSEEPSNLGAVRPLVTACIRKSPLFEDLAAMTRQILG